MNLIVLTDGVPDRGENPEMVIVEMAKRLEKIKARPVFFFLRLPTSSSSSLSFIDAAVPTWNFVRANRRRRPSGGSSSLARRRLEREARVGSLSPSCEGPMLIL
jgi:hypothetical protein